MGCFFACFRVKECDRRKTHLVSKSIASKNRDPLVTKNQLSSVFLCEEKGSPSKTVEHLSLQQNFQRENADEELKNQVKLLKSCGALLETPVEVRRASDKSTVQSPSNDGVPSNFHKRLPDTSCKTLDWDEQAGQLSNTATKVDESPVQPETKPGSYCSEENLTQRKMVQFDEGVENISSNVHLSPQSENEIKQLGSNISPYPTPLSLSEDMYSPGAAYTPKSTGNDTRIQTQYVYPSVEKLSPRNELREGTLPGQSNDGENLQQISLMSSSETFTYNKGSQDQQKNFKEEADFNQETPKIVVSSLSKWLKPPPSSDERWTTKSSDKSPADRPIIGLVATHWNENEPTCITKKWFDGNGIPNSTNKYKEDQKVSWHATPFEERLEKALSDEKLFPRRQFSGRPVNLDCESDTAAS